MSENHPEDAPEALGTGGETDAGEQEEKGSIGAGIYRDPSYTSDKEQIASLKDQLQAATSGADGGSVHVTVTPKRVTFYVVMDETASANDATVTLTVELSPDDGATLVSYDKLLTQDGTDAPQSSEVYTTDEDDVLSISPEDVVDYLKITLAGTNVDASDFYAVKVWMVYTY